MLRAGSAQGIRRPNTAPAGSELAALMHPGSRQIVVEVGHVHAHDSGGLPFQPDVHRVTIGHRRQLFDGIILGHPLIDGLLHIGLPLENVIALLVQVALVTHRAVAGDEDLLVEPTQCLQGLQLLVRVSLLDESLHLVENIVAGEDDAFLLDEDRRLVEGMPGHMNHPERMIPHV